MLESDIRMLTTSGSSDLSIDGTLSPNLASIDIHNRAAGYFENGSDQSDGLSALVSDFLADSYEDMLITESILAEGTHLSTGNGELANLAFKLHSLSNTCRLLRFQRIERIANACINFLSALQERNTQQLLAHNDALMLCVQRIRHSIWFAARTGHEGVGDDATLIAKLDSISRPLAEPSNQSALEARTD